MSDQELTMWLWALAATLVLGSLFIAWAIRHPPKGPHGDFTEHQWVSAGAYYIRCSVCSAEESYGPWIDY